MASGNAATVADGDKTVIDLTVDAFDGVVAGDTVYISGYGTFEVDVATDNNNLEMTDALSVSPTPAIDVHWRIYRGGIEPDSVEYVGQDTGGSNKWCLIWDTLTFVVD